MYLHSTLLSLGYYLKSKPQAFLLLLFFFLISITYLYVKRIKNPLILHWPILGILPLLIRNSHRISDLTVELANACGRTVFVRGPLLTGMNFIATCDPINIEYILKTNFSNFPKGSNFIETFEPLGDGIFNVDSDVWKAQRRIARMAFGSKKFRSNIDNTTKRLVQEALLPLLEHVSKHSMVVDLQDVFLRYSFDTTTCLIFGINTNYLSIDFPKNGFAEALDEITEVIFYRHIVPRWWWKLCRLLVIGNERKMSKAWRIVDQHLSEYIAAKNEDTAIGIEASDLLQVSSSLKDSEYHELLQTSSYKFLRDTSLSNLYAGRDTTASGLTWFFWLISKNPSVETKILEELRLILFKKTEGVDDVKKKWPWVFEIHDIIGMEYFHAAICESLRLYPPVPFNRKAALKEDVLPDGTVVKPGQTIILLNYAMGRMESVWGKDCLEFKPERWIGEDGNLNHETMSKLMAFSTGPRVCIGKDMAFLSMKLAASAILFNFHVHVLEGQKVDPKSAIGLKMKNQFMVKFKKRIVQ